GGGADNFAVPYPGEELSHLAGCGLAPPKTLPVGFPPGSARINTRILHPQLFEKPIDGFAATGQSLAPKGGRIITVCDHQRCQRPNIGHRAVLEILHQTRSTVFDGITVYQWLMIL